MMHDAYIALGSNIEPREKFLIEAVLELKKHPEIDVVKESSIYVTKPVGYIEQNDFLNQVIHIKSSLEPIELLQVCQSVENELGRKRLIRFGPRTIDLDVLIYNNIKIQTEELTIPHPRMTERAFVLIPLHELNENILINDLPIKEWLLNLPNDMKDDVKVWNEK